MRRKSDHPAIRGAAVGAGKNRWASRWRTSEGVKAMSPEAGVGRSERAGRACCTQMLSRKAEASNTSVRWPQGDRKFNHQVAVGKVNVGEAREVAARRPQGSPLIYIIRPRLYYDYERGCRADEIGRASCRERV